MQELNEPEFFKLIDDYQAAKCAVDKAEATLEALKTTIKSYGTISVGDVAVELASIDRESVSWSDIKQKQPSLAAQLINAGLVKKSSYEKLKVSIGNKL